MKNKLANSVSVREAISEHLAFLYGGEKSREKEEGISNWSGPCWPR